MNPNAPGKNFDQALSAMRQTSSPPANRRDAIRYVACMGDATDPDAWSSIPYHFLQAARHADLLDEGLRLDPRAGRIRRARWIWNAGRLLGGSGSGGFQYSTKMLEMVWEPVRGQLAGATIVNQFQLFPPWVVADSRIQKWFYLDATLSLLADHYEMRLGRRIFKDAVRREREGYHAAAGIATFSGFAAESVINDYGVPAARVHVVPPGANISIEAYAEWELQAIGRRQGEIEGEARPLRLAFVGREYIRKGLDRLLEAIALARQRGFAGTLDVVGIQRDQVPSQLAQLPGIRWHGLISRRREPLRLLNAISNCDVGVLLSRRELSAIALREYLALGMVVLGPAVGGCRDLMEPGASVQVGPDDSTEAIAQILLSLERDAGRMQRLRACAWATRKNALWSQSVSKFKAVWGNSPGARSLNPGPVSS